MILFSWLRFFPSDPATAALLSSGLPAIQVVYLTRITWRSSLAVPKGRELILASNTPFPPVSIDNSCFTAGQESPWPVATSKPSSLLAPHEPVRPRPAAGIGLDLSGCGTVTTCQGSLLESCSPKLLPPPKCLHPGPSPSTERVLPHGWQYPEAVEPPALLKQRLQPAARLTLDPMNGLHRNRQARVKAGRSASRS